MTEEDLVGIWIVDPVKKTRLAAVTRHFEKHRDVLGVSDIGHYVRLAVAFREEAKKRNGSGKPVFGRIPGVKSWIKTGRFIHLAPNNEIVSFGVVDHN
ncbi:MAG: hypothetical protein ACRYFS_16620 [Janthinobacterium lividum]